MVLSIIYYRTLNSNIVPVKKFLKKYLPQEEDTQKQKNHKANILTFIRNIIKDTADKRGAPNPPHRAPLHGGYNFHKMKIRDGNKQERILYCCHNENLVLLNAYEKPYKYEKGSKKRVDRYEEEKYRETQTYYEDFISNPQNYDEYE